MPLNAQTIDPTVSFWLKIGSGLFWTVAYILIIRRGLKDKYYGMPVIALCANVSWEFMFSFVIPHSKPQLYIDYVWLTFDIGILIQYLWLGKKEFPSQLSSKMFYPAFGLTLVMAFLAILMVSYEFDDKHGIYSAFAQNLMMSILFVYLLLKRNSSAGQSLYIAICKLIGTVIPSIFFHLLFPNSCLLHFLFFTILIFDVIYCVMLYLQLKSENMKPWLKV